MSESIQSANSIPRLREQKRRGRASRAFVELGGTRLYLGVFGTPEAVQAYDRAIAEWLAAGRELTVCGGPRRPGLGSDTIEMLLADHWRHLEARYVGRPKAMSKHRQALGELRRLYGDLPGERFGPRALRAVRDAFIRRGWAYKTVNEHVRIVVAFVRWCVADELLSPDRLRAVEAVEPLRASDPGARTTPKRRRVDLRRVFAVKRGIAPELRAAILLQLLTGARPGEILGLRPCDLDMSPPRQRGVWIARLERHKNAHRGKSRTLVFGPRAQRVIRMFLAGCPVHEPLLSPRRAEARRRDRLHAQRVTPLSCGNIPGSNRRVSAEREPGLAYTSASYGRAVARACVEFGIEHWSPGLLRHTAKDRFERDGGLEAASQVLGHHSLEMTRHYGEQQINQAADLMRVIG